MPLIFPHYYMNLVIDSCDSLPIAKVLTLHNAIIFIKPIVNKDQNHYSYNIFLEKCSNQLAKNNQFFSDSMMMLRFRETKIVKKNYAAKKPINIREVNILII